MADITAGSLKWEADVDTTRFESSLKRITALAQQAAKQFSDAWADGSLSAEKAVNAAFDKLDSVVAGTVSKAGPWGAAFATAWSLGLGDKLRDLSTKVEEVLANWKVGERVFGGLSDEASKAQEVADDFFDTLASHAGIASFAVNAIKSGFDGMAESLIHALDSLAGRLDEISGDGQKALDKITQSLKQVEGQLNLVGLEGGAKLRQSLEQAVSGWANLTGADTRGLKESLDNAERLGNLLSDRQEDLRQDADWERQDEEAIKERDRAIQAITQSLQRQGQMQLAAADAIQKTAYARALERAQAQAQGSGRRAGVADNPTVRAAEEKSANTAQLAADIKFQSDMAQAIKEQTSAYDLQTASLGANAGEVERLRFQQQELLKAQKDGVVVTDELRAKIALQASALGAAAEKAALASDAFKDLQQVGTTVAASIERAFGSWISGQSLQWKEFIRGMQQDLEKLALRLALMPIFGGGGSSTGGGLFADLFKSFLPGKASGGSVESGQPYIVGEAGPELFIPNSGGGSIIPNSVLGASGPGTLNMTLNLSGANGDEAIARISAQAARMAAMAAVQQSNEQFPMRQRRLDLLGA
jgi:hypothetical protein